MVLVKHLISPATLPQPSIIKPPSCVEQLSVLSYNILLPNSEDGWWTYKMYSPPLPKELQYQSSWEYRQDLLKKWIQLIDADVVCKLPFKEKAILFYSFAPTHGTNIFELFLKL